MPTARAPWTPRRVMHITTDDGYAATCCNGSCEQGRKCPLNRPACDDVPTAQSLRARVMNAAYWIGGTVGVVGLAAACDRTSALFQ